MNMLPLTSQVCGPCSGVGDRLDKASAQALLHQIPGWELAEDGLSLTRDFAFPTFKGSIAFINQVANLAESEGHHPDIYCFYTKVTLKLTTHAVEGLSKNDFILAAKISALS